MTERKEEETVDYCIYLDDKIEKIPLNGGEY